MWWSLSPRHFREVSRKNLEVRHSLTNSQITLEPYLLAAATGNGYYYINVSCLMGYIVSVQPSSIEACHLHQTPSSELPVTHNTANTIL